MKVTGDMVVRVRRRVWADKKTGETVECLLLRARGFHVIIPYDQARRVCDELHDACDDRDRALREAKQ